MRGFLEGSTGSCQNGVVAGIEVVDDGFGEGILGREAVEKGEDIFALGPVADGVESGIRAELGKEAGVGVSLGAEVKLHRPVVFGSPLTEVKHEKGTERIGFGGICGIALASIGKDTVGIGLGTRMGEGVSHSVVGEATAVFVEMIKLFAQGKEELVEGLDAGVELIEPGVEDIGTVDEEGFVGAEGGINFGGGVGVLVVGLVVVERIDRVVGGADGVDAEFAEETEGGEVWGAEAFVALVPNSFGGIGVEEGVDAEAALEFEVGPIVEGVAEGEGDGFGKGLKFFAIGGVAGDVGFGDAGGSHGAPFVVVVTEPEGGDVVPPLVLGDFVGWEVGVVIDDGKVLRGVVVKGASGLGGEEKVFVEVRFHGMVGYEIVGFLIEKIDYGLSCCSRAGLGGPPLAR